MKTIRDQIVNEVGPGNPQFADRGKILALGQEAVPILVDLFLHPATPYGDINQAEVADALIGFSKLGNKEADTFIRRIARGQVPLAASWGNEAAAIVKQHFAWIGVNPSEPTVASSQTDAAADVDVITSILKAVQGFDSDAKHAAVRTAETLSQPMKVALATQLLDLLGTTDFLPIWKSGQTLKVQVHGALLAAIGPTCAESLVAFAATRANEADLIIWCERVLFTMAEKHPATEWPKTVSDKTVTFLEKNMVSHPPEDQKARAAAEALDGLRSLASSARPSIDQILSKHPGLDSRVRDIYAKAAASIPQPNLTPPASLNAPSNSSRPSAVTPKLVTKATVPVGTPAPTAANFPKPTAPQAPSLQVGAKVIAIVISLGLAILFVPFTRPLFAEKFPGMSAGARGIISVVGAVLFGTTFYNGLVNLIAKIRAEIKR